MGWGVVGLGKTQNIKSTKDFQLGSLFLVSLPSSLFGRALAYWVDCCGVLFMSMVAGTF